MHNPHEHHESTPAASAIDPICHMTVDPAKAAGTHVHEGQTYYFCSTHCLHKFRAEPGKYIGGAPRNDEPTGTLTVIPSPRHPVTPSALATEYTCPMHPEVVSDRPGSCPKCGMALEPRTISVEEGPNPELVDMTRRFRVGLVLGLPIFVIAMAGMIQGLSLLHTYMGALNWVQLLLATPVVFWCGWPFFERAWAS